MIDKECLANNTISRGAGADTTSIGMRTCLYYICKYPKYYRLVQDEVDAFYTQNNLTEPMTYLQTQQLPMLKAVVKEATRLLPSIVFQLLRYAPENFSVRGKPIPAGTHVGISPIAQNRDTEIFGKDADEFRPERWLEDRDTAGFMDSCLMTFGGSGPRMCVGKNIALVSRRCKVDTENMKEMSCISTNCFLRSNYTNFLHSSSAASTSKWLIHRSHGA